jgi:uncharacterized membrane protein
LNPLEGFVGQLISLSLASYACRAGGFWLMRWVPITPRVEAGLSQAPLAVMIGVVAPAALHGGPAEWIGLIAVVLAMLVQRNDLIGMLAGVMAVGLARWAL